MATDGSFNGNLLLVYVDDTAIDCLTSSSISLSRDMIDASCKDNAGQYEALPGQKTGTISAEGLVAFDATEGIDELLADYAAGTSVTVKFSTEVTGDTYIQSAAYIESIDWDGPLNDVTTYSVTFHLYGAQTISTVA